METDKTTQPAGFPIIRTICGAIGGGIALSLASAPILLLKFGFMIDGSETSVNTISVLIFVAGLVAGGLAAARRAWTVCVALAVAGIAGIVAMGILLH